MNATIQSTIDFDPDIDQALRMKAAHSHRSIFFKALVAKDLRGIPDQKIWFEL